MLLVGFGTQLAIHDKTNCVGKEPKDVVVKFYHILRDIVEVLKHHDNLERQEMKTGLGIYHKDDARYIRVQRSKKNDA